MKDAKKIIFSGIQPSGMPTLGNYIGAIRNWVKLQDEYHCIYSMVDLHAITVRQDPAELRRKCLELMGILLAAGLDPDKNLIYYQSHVPAHAELSWVLGCYCYMGELGRMTQFKEKSRSHAENINAGLFTYPVLMAADILLYQTDLVPVGDDQKQHMELARNLAERFNSLYQGTFVVPEAYIPEVGARVMSLTDPTRKMSKSDPEETYIALLDGPDVIRRKLRRAVTDLGSEVRADPEKPGVSNLLSIYCALTGEPLAQVEERFSGQGYGAFKAAVADAVIAALEPLQNEYSRLVKDKAYLNGILTASREKAAEMAERTMRKVRKKVGLAPLQL